MFRNLFQGRNYYIADHLRESHTEIIPKKIFHTDSNIGLRDIILKVIALIKQVGIYLFYGINDNQ